MSGIGVTGSKNPPLDLETILALTVDTSKGFSIILRCTRIECLRDYYNMVQGIVTNDSATFSNRATYFA